MNEGPSERQERKAAHYRARAAEAARLSLAAATPSERHGFARVAEKWRALADQLENDAIAGRI